MVTRKDYLLTYLAILVGRNGGTLTIENLSDYSGKEIELKDILEAEYDITTLVTIIKKPDHRE